MKSIFPNNDIYLMEKLNKKDIFKVYKDILQSFEININSNSVMYDELSNSFYDVMTTENMKDCVNYLKFLVQNDILPISYNDNISFDNENLFSQYTYMRDDIGFPYSLYLINDEYNYRCVIEYNPTSSVYLLGKNTIVDENVNNFIDQIYNNISANRDLRYGILKEDYDYMDGEIILLEDTNLSNIPRVVGRFPDNSRIMSNNFYSNNYYEVQSELMESGIVKTLSIYSLLPYAKFNTYYNGSDTNVFSQEYNKHVYNYLSLDDISYTDYINEYIKRAKQKNSVEEINKLNKMINSDIKFSY